MGLVKYPLDYGALREGTTIAPEVVAQIMSVSATDTDAVRLAILKLSGLIKTHRPDLTPVCRVAGLVILTADEASHYLARRVAGHSTGILVACTRLACVPLEEMTPEQRQAHEGRVRITAYYQQGVLSATRRIQLESHNSAGVAQQGRLNSGEAYGGEN